MFDLKIFWKSDDVRNSGQDMCTRVIFLTTYSQSVSMGYDVSKRCPKIISYGL